MIDWEYAKHLISTNRQAAGIIGGIIVGFLLHWILF